MVRIIRTDSKNPDFIELVRDLDAELAERDGEDHPFYAQFNKIDKIKFAVVAYENEKPLGCGAIKEYTPGLWGCISVLALCRAVGVQIVEAQS